MKGESEAVGAYEALCKTVDPETLADWTDNEEKAQIERRASPSAMNIFDVQLEKGMLSSHQHMLSRF